VDESRTLYTWHSPSFQILRSIEKVLLHNNATHYVQLGKKRRENSTRNCYIISPRVVIKAMIFMYTEVLFLIKDYECSVVQCGAVWRSVVQCGAVWCSVVKCHVYTSNAFDQGSRIQCVAVCFSVLLCVSLCCCVLLCVAVCCCVLLCVAVCCSVTHLQVTQFVAVCCSVLQFAAVCYSILPCLVGSGVKK